MRQDNDGLSDFELTILQGAADGQTYEQTARKLGHTSDAKVKNQVRYTIEKLGAKNITNAVAVAIRRGRID